MTSLLLDPPDTRLAPARKRRRRRFSLNALAIQLSAFALSFTLVALLVVSGSRAAFVEENESVKNHVPVAAPAEEVEPRPGGSAPPVSRPTATPSALAPSLPPAEPTIGPTTAPITGPTTAPTVAPGPAPTRVVELTDTDAGTALFDGDVVLAPGVALDRCIAVTYVGDVDPSSVLLYAAGASGELAPYLDLTISMGTATADDFGICASFTAAETLFTGTLAEFVAQHADYGSGRATWNPVADGETRGFRFRVSVRDEPAAAGKSAGFGFTWEARAE